jgi:hypothetical protein
MLVNGLRGRSRITVAEQTLFLRDNRLKMQKVILAVSGDHAPPLSLRSRVVLELSDIALFKGIGLVGWIHGIDGNPSINIVGEPLLEPLHDTHVHESAGHDLLNEDVPREKMEYLRPKLIAGVLHSRINMPQHDICLLIGFVDVHFFEIIIGEKGENSDNAQKYNAQSEHEFSSER